MTTEITFNQGTKVVMKSARVRMEYTVLESVGDMLTVEWTNTSTGIRMYLDFPADLFKVA